MRILIHDEAIRNRLSQTDVWRIDQVKKNILAAGSYGHNNVHTIGGLPVISISRGKGIVVGEKVPFEDLDCEVFCLFEVIDDIDKCPGGDPNKEVARKRRNISDESLHAFAKKWTATVPGPNENKPDLPEQFHGWVIPSRYKTPADRDPLATEVKETRAWKKNILRVIGMDYLAEIHIALSRIYLEDFPSEADASMRRVRRANCSNGDIYLITTEHHNAFLCELKHLVNDEGREIILVDIHGAMDQDDDDLEKWSDRVIKRYLAHAADNDGGEAYYPLIRWYLGQVFDRGGGEKDSKTAAQMYRIWRGIENDSLQTALCLTEEEGTWLKRLIEGVDRGVARNTLPAFINGPAGSGKSTLLHYIFFHYWTLMNDRETETHFKGQPLYLTLNDDLLKKARESVKAMITLDANLLEETEKRLGQKMNFEEFEHHVDVGLKSSFKAFRELMLDLLPTERRVKFESKDGRREVVFATFEQLFQKQKHRWDVNTRRLSPELCWHVIRSYIKGYKADGYLSDGDFARLSESERADIFIDDSQYSAIYSKVWPWYKELTCADGPYFDQQDIAREVVRCLEAKVSSVKKAYPGMRYMALFCDEAQDLTGVELQIIQKMSYAAQYDLQRMKRANMCLPYIFAGDPMQTVNPSGFRWENLTSNIYKNLLEPIDSAMRPYKVELSYNYRSPREFTLLANLIQLVRYRIFGGLSDPQVPYCTEPGFPSIERYEMRSDLDSLMRNMTDGIVLLPCATSEEDENAYVGRNSFLSKLKSYRPSPMMMSVMAAKGLEYPKVFLFNFGEEFFGDGPFDLDNITESDRNIELAFKLNRCYVALTRATRQMVILDTQRGVDNFWSKIYDRNWRTVTLDAMKDVLRKQWEKLLPRPELRYLSEMTTSGNFASCSKDDLIGMANRIFEDACANKNPYGMNKAKLAYENLLGYEHEKTHVRIIDGPKEVVLRDQVIRCDAYICWFEGQYYEASKRFKNVGDGANAERVMCCWEGRLWSELQDCNTEDMTFTQRTIVKLMGGNTRDATMEFCRTVVDSADLVSRDTHWSEAFAKVAKYAIELVDSPEATREGELLALIADTLSKKAALHPVGRSAAFKVYVNLALMSGSDEDWSHAAQLRGCRLDPSVNDDILMYDAHRAVWPEFVSACKRRRGLVSLCFKRWKAEGLSSSVEGLDDTTKNWMLRTVLVNNAGYNEQFDFAKQIGDRSFCVKKAVDGQISFDRKLQTLSMIWGAWRNDSEISPFDFTNQVLQDAKSHEDLYRVLTVIGDTVGRLNPKEKEQVFGCVKQRLASSQELRSFLQEETDYDCIIRIYAQSDLDIPKVNFANSVLDTISNNVIQARAAEALVYARRRLFERDHKYGFIEETRQKIEGLRARGAKIESFDYLWTNAYLIELVHDTFASCKKSTTPKSCIEGANYNEENENFRLVNAPFRFVETASKITITNIQTEEKAVIHKSDWNNQSCELQNLGLHNGVEYRVHPRGISIKLPEWPDSVEMTFK